MNNNDKAEIILHIVRDAKANDYTDGYIILRIIKILELPFENIKK